MPTSSPPGALSDFTDDMDSHSMLDQVDDDPDDLVDGAENEDDGEDLFEDTMMAYVALALLTHAHARMQ